MPLTAAQIVTLACQEAKCPGFTSQAGQFLNLTLQDLCQDYDLAAATGAFAFNFNSATGQGSGPYTLPADYLRTQVIDGKDTFLYIINGVPYPLIQVTLSEYKWLVQTPGFQSYPYNYATDLSQSPPQLFVWPPASGAYAASMGYYKLMPDIATPENSAVVPWFRNTQVLIRSVAGRLMGLTGDSRQMEYMGEDPEKYPNSWKAILDAWLKNASDREGAVKTVGKDRRRWGRPFDQLKNSKQIGWCLAACLLGAWAYLAPVPANACTTPCTKAQITTDINTNWPDNTTAAITPAVLRAQVLELLNSYLDLAGNPTLAWCLMGNATSGTTASYGCFTIGGLTNKATPAPTDLVMIQDQAATGALKYATITQLLGAVTSGVSSIAGNTGAFTLAGGVTNSTNQIQLDGAYTGFATKNCTLTASVATNILTVALKDNAGNDPSATSPCFINYRSPTAATGQTTSVPQTTALSINTFATGATLGTANSTAFRLWVVAFNNAGTNVMALYNASNPTTCRPIDETQVQTSAAISGAATALGVYYTPNGTTVSAKAIRILGYVEYNSTGLATAGTYATAPNFVQVFGPGVKKPCDVVQSTYNGVGTLQTASGATFPTVASPGNTIQIAMTSAANLVRSMASANVTTGVASTTTLGIYRAPGAFACTTIVGVQKAVQSVSASTQIVAALSFNAIDKPNSLTPTYGYCYGVVTSSGAAAGADLMLDEIMG